MNAALSGDYDILDDLKIVGVGANTPQIFGLPRSANMPSDRVFHIIGTASVILEQLQISEANIDGCGDGIANEGTLTLVMANVSRNASIDCSAGFYNTGYGVASQHHREEL